MTNTHIRIADEHVIFGNLSSPLASGGREEFVISVHGLNTVDIDTIYLSVVAVDEMGNQGQPSNIVTLSHAKELSVPGLRIHHPDYSMTSLAVSVSLAFVFFILVVVGICLLVIRSRKTRSRKITRIDERASTVSSASLNVDLGHMNYMYEGEYRKRLPEEPETWGIGAFW